jgi:hypothetical protein
MIESPWHNQSGSFEATSALEDAVRSVRSTIDRAQALKELKEVALNALINVENNLPKISFDEVRQAGGAEAMIYSGLILTVSKTSQDPKMVTKLNDAFGKYFSFDVREISKEARGTIRERFEN